MKYCVRCKNAIDTKEERYKKIEDHDQGKLIKKVFMHHSCWEEMIIKKKQEGEILNMAKKMMTNVAGAVQ